MIERLENNEQILLMYVAGELPEEDAAEVQQLLATDGGFRREYEAIRSAQAAAFGYLGALDEVSPLPVSAEFAARRVGRAMRQQLAAPKPKHFEETVDRPARTWRWFYPTAVAASIAIIGMVWLSREADLSTPQVVQAHTDPAPMVPSMPDLAPHLPGDAVVAVEPDELLLRTLQRQALGLDPAESKPQAEEDPKQVASVDPMPQDEVSQYLLSVAPAGQ